MVSVLPKNALDVAHKTSSVLSRKINMRSYGDKPKAFLDKVPNGLLPAIELDGELMTESLQIMARIERVYRSRIQSYGSRTRV